MSMDSERLPRLHDTNSAENSPAASISVRPRRVDQRPAAPRAVAADRLDLQDIRALIRQEHRGVRTGHHRRQIENANTIQWTGHTLPHITAPGGNTRLT